MNLSFRNEALVQSKFSFQ